MIISKSEALRLLKNDGNLLHDDTAIHDMERIVEQEVVNEIAEELVNPERPILYTAPGTRRNIPPIFREMIAIQANMTNNAASVADAFGISHRHGAELKGGNVNRPEHRLEKGLTESDVALAKALEASLSKVRDKALDKIYASMDAIDSDSLPNYQPKVLANIAASLSRVVTSTLRNQKDAPTINVQTVFYSPEKASKEAYEVIDV
jgi:hypothetical protein